MRMHAPSHTSENFLPAAFYRIIYENEVKIGSNYHTLSLQGFRNRLRINDVSLHNGDDMQRLVRRDVFLWSSLFYCAR